MKLFVTDLDGSFLDENHTVIPRSVELIQQLKSVGCEFAVCTGRNLASIDILFRDIDLEFVKMGLNGAITVDENNNVLTSRQVERQDIELLFNYALRYDISLTIFSAHETYSPNPTLVYETVAKNWAAKGGVVEDPKAFYEEHFELSPIRKVANVDELLSYNDDVLKIEFHPQSKEISDMLYHILEELPTVDVSTSGFNNIEITHIDAQKGLAIQELCKQRNIDEDQVLVVGDSYNDISMLSRFKNSYAMGQADDKIRNIANYTAKTNKEEGVLDLMTKVINKEI